MRLLPEISEFSREKMHELPKEFDENLVNKTVEHLEMIKDSLRDFVKKIRDEKPDMVIFLDRSARVFGEPIFKYLAEQKLPQMPEIKFYNDDYLKNLYLDGKLNKEAVENELSGLKDKKVFFLDETFSSGKGAATIKKAKEILGNKEIYYFALTQDKGPKVLEDFDVWFDIPEEEHKRNLEEIKSDSGFRIYDNDIRELFSREASRLYVAEADINGKMRTIPNTNNFEDILENPRDKEEYRSLKEKEKQNTIRIVKEKILETLRKE